MRRAVLVACGLLFAACAGAWSSPAAAAVPAPCPTGTVCRQANGPDSSYTVSKSASPSGHVEPGDRVTYTVTVTASADVAIGSASFTDNLHDNVLDDATWDGFVGDAHGAQNDSDVVTWVNSDDLTADQSVSISYAVIVDDPDAGDGVLRNSVEPGSQGECGTCAVTNAVEGTFTVQQSASPPGGTVHPGDTVTYTVDVAAGEAPAYASFAESLSTNARYAGDARASGGAVSTKGNTVSWNGSLAAGATVTVTFSATVKAAATGRLTSTVAPVSNDPSRGSCAADGACRVSYRVLAPAGPTGGPVSAVTSARASDPPTSGAVEPVSVSAPTTSAPRIADTGARTAGLGELAALLLLGGSALLLLGLTPWGAARRRPRHRH